MVRITFYDGDVNLGTYDCMERSSQEDRNAIARNNDIDHYTKFILDDGRVIGYVDNGLLISWRNGVDCELTFNNNHLNTNTMDEQNNVSQDNYARSVGGPMDLNPRTPDECVPTVKRNKARQIQINQADHGYLVNVGCQTLVFENMDTLIEKLTAYLKDPNTVEKRWMTEGIL